MLVCWLSGSALTTPVFAETLTYSPDRHNQTSSFDQSAYQLRRAQARAERKSFPPPQLAVAPPVAPAQIAQPAPPKHEPMKITIPNLGAIEKAQAAVAPSSEPAEFQAVASSFKPLLETPSAQQMAALSPAAGPETIPAAPLIAAPDDTTPSPPAPPLAPPAAAPVAISNDPVITKALDEALKDDTNAEPRSSVPDELPPLVPSKAATKKKSVKAAAQSKPYSPLDSEPNQGISGASKMILKRIPSNLDRPKNLADGPLSIDRAKDLEAISQPEQPAAPETSVKHEEMGIKIEVKNRAANLDYELEKAYNALSSGQPSLAIEIYKNVLANDPNNKGALFGLATTYHRSGQLEQARTLYGKLLAIDPNNRDGLNNFLVLLADEAPQEALQQLEKLEQRNPVFSPIPAQMAVIYQRMGDADKAAEKMFKAVNLSPENLVYRYNLAIMLDRQKKYDEAARLYKQLLEAASRGETIPGNTQKIQQRLTFISSNRT